MKLSVGTTPVAVNAATLATQYPDRDDRGQTVVVQNLGPGDLFLDYDNTPLDGLKIAPDSAYEFPPAVSSVRGLFLVATEASDVRIVVMG